MRYTHERIKEMIEHQTNSYSWEFMFLAANLDATEEGASFGIKADKSYNFVADKQSTDKMFRSVSMAYCSYRSGIDDVDLKSME